MNGGCRDESPNAWSRLNPVVTINVYSRSLTTPFLIGSRNDDAATANRLRSPDPPGGDPHHVGVDVVAGLDSSPPVQSGAGVVELTVTEGIQAAIYAFKRITSPYWLNEKRLRDSKVALIGEKTAQAARRPLPRR